MKMMSKETVKLILETKCCYGISCGPRSNEWCPAYSLDDDCDVPYPEGILTDKAKSKLEEFIKC